MALHLTKVAFGVSSIEELLARWESRRAAGGFAMTTRYLPKRHAEIAGQGSLFWIVKHQLVARSPILGFGEAEQGRTGILLDPQPVLVRARPKRAHQGWRYLEGTDAPADLGGAADGLEDLPSALAGELAGLGLI
jgi:hypothetical protein